MIPFYIYYSMFGFQRFGDFAWAAGDMQANGFLLVGLQAEQPLQVKACNIKMVIVMFWQQPYLTAILMIHAFVMN